MVSVAHMRDRISAVDWSFTARINFWIEAMWLSALALVPVLFSFNASLTTFDEAKSYALHFFALITFVLLIWDGAYRFAAARRRGEHVESVDVVAWLRADRANLLLAAIGIFTFIYVLSTALSPMPYFSLWGVTPASSGYNLYSFLSMMVILVAVVTRVRSVKQVWRILYLIAAVGSVTSIYGLAQHFGWDPISVSADSSRIFATFGNPIYFGAYLVMSIPITAAIAADHRNAGRKRLLAALAVAFALQLSAMWFTGSRGPLAGLVAAGAVSLIGMVLVLPRRQTASASAVAIAVAVITAALIVLPGDTVGARSLQFGGELSELTNRDGAGHIQGGLGGRGEIWGDAFQLSLEWERLPEDTGQARLLRPLFGLGPDMLRFSSSLVAGPRAALQVVDHAHNRLLHVLVEQGWLGLVAMLNVLVVAFWLLLLIARKLRSQKSEHGSANAVIYVAISGALAGVAVEQMAGVGRVSDLLTSWALIGLLIVLYRSVSSYGHPQVEITVLDDGKSSQRPGRRRERASITAQGQAAVVASFVVGLSALVIALVVFVLIDTQSLRASRLAMDALEHTDSNVAYRQFLDAQAIAPQIEIFTIFPAEQLYDDARELLELGEPEEAVQLAEEAFRQLLAYHKRNPLAVHTRILLAETAALLVEIGAVDFTDEMVLRYQDLADQFPTEAGVLAVVANAYAAAERYEESIAFTDRSIEIEAVTRPIPQAWWVRGSALDKLGRKDEAISAFETAIERDPESEFAKLSHRSLAILFEQRGDTEAAEAHRTAADELEAAVTQ